MTGREMLSNKNQETYEIKQKQGTRKQRKLACKMKRKQKHRTKHFICYVSMLYQNISKGQILSHVLK
jgi:hypothetical protein